LLYRGTWVKSLLRAGWRFDTPHRRKFLFARSDLREIPDRLRAPAMQDRLVETVEPFVQWILQAPSRGDPNVFQLVCDHGGWNVPWELVIAAMEHPSEAWRIAFSRRLKRAQEIAPSRLDHPLRVLILRGEARLGLLTPLNLDREIETLRSTWAGLPASVRASIESPLVADAYAATLHCVIGDHAPDVIWFVGHGRREPEPGLLCRDGVWVSPKFFFEQFPRDSPPLFVVLMACDTASGEAEPEPLDQPSFAREAFEAGVAALLAMQAPIGDVSSKILARELFMELAAGSSPAVGLARARMVLRRLDFRGRNAVDWAAPVVWSAVDDSTRWRWNHPFAESARHQLFGREILQSQLVHPETAAVAPTEKELETARVWTARRRTWVLWKSAEKESVALAHRVLAAIQYLERDLVLVVDLRGDTPELALQQWAERVMADVRPDVHPDELIDFVNGLRNPAAGWRHVSLLAGATIGVLGAPDYDAQHWFWSPLADAAVGPRVVALSERPFAGAHDGDWGLEKMLLTETTDAAVRALQSAPRLARALSVLNEPLRRSAMELASPDDTGAKRVTEWAEADQVLIEIADGLLMADSAAEVIRAHSSEKEMSDAHLDCYAILYQMTAGLSTPLLEEMAEHLRLGGEMDAHAQLASQLTARYWRENRPHAAASVLDALGLENFAPQYFLYAAWALTALGRIDESRFLLERTFPGSPLEEAWKHGLAADNAKAAGDRDGAVREIESAIAVCAAGLQSGENAALRRAWRNYRQDHARILQFLYYEPEKARDLYIALLHEWQHEPEAELDVAIVRRNLAECFSTLASSADDPLFLKAADALKDARAVAEKYLGYPLLADVLYEESKLAERALQPALADEKLDAALRAAREAGYRQMVAVASARIFWREPFTLARWSDVADMLELHGQHGWPIRTLINGRLRTAETLTKRGDDVAALDQLLRAEAALKKHPAFARGSDRERRARTAAGIDILSRRLGSPRNSWAELQMQEWAREYLAARKASAPEDVW
jgi:CHAT domain